MSHQDLMYVFLEEIRFLVTSLAFRKPQIHVYKSHKTQKPEMKILLSLSPMLPIIISCRPKLVWLAFFCLTQNNKF